MSRGCGCRGSSCSCLIVAGSNVTVTGSGRSFDPYVIAAMGGGGGGGCAYAPEMTRAEAIALRDAAGLVVGCPVLITDGPTIGTPAYTSSTLILLEPVADNMLGSGAMIYPPDFGDGAWVGMYNIDDDAIFDLADNRGNRVIDNGGGVVIATQFPWGYNLVKNNQIHGEGGYPISLVGWGDAAEAGAEIESNTIGPSYYSDGSFNGVLVDLTGLQNSNYFNWNQIQGGTVEITTPVAVGPEGTGFSFSSNRVGNLHRILIAPASSPANIEITGCDFFGRDRLSGPDYMFRFVAASTSAVIRQCKFQGGRGGGSPSRGISLDGSGGTITMLDSQFLGGPGLRRYVGSTCDLVITRSEFKGVGGSYGPGLWDADGVSPGTITIDESTLVQFAPNRDPSTPGKLTIRQSTLVSSGTFQFAASTKEILILRTSMISSSIQSNYHGLMQVRDCVLTNSFIGCDEDLGTMDLLVTGSTLVTSSIHQVRIGPTGEDVVEGFTLVEGNLVFDGTTGDDVSVEKCSITDGSTVNIVNPTYVGVDTLQRTAVEAGSTLNIATGAAVDKSRFGAGATFNTGAFVHTSVIIDGAFTKTATANNTNKLCNAGFDNIV